MAYDSNNLRDITPRYAPAVVMTLKGRRPVVRYEAFPPSMHPVKCPIISTVTAVKLTTDIPGEVRWYGVDNAHINSELRMVVSGFDAGFEEMRAWEVCSNGL